MRGTARELIGQAQATLAAAGIESARLEARLLLAHALGLEPASLLLTAGTVHAAPALPGLLARRAFLFAKLGAEYVLRLLPAGTHDWRRFVTPAELAAALGAAGLRLADSAGLIPGLGGWRVGRDLAVNYIVCAEA